MTFAYLKILFWNRATLYVVGVILAVATVIYWHKSGVNRAVMTERARLTAIFEQSKTTAIEQERLRSSEIVKQLESEYVAKNEAVKLDAQRIINQHRAGTVRLSIPARCTEQRIDASGIARDTSAAFGQTRAELSSEAVEFLVVEAQRADEVVLERNELIDVIERLKK